MVTETTKLDELISGDYPHGFFTAVATDSLPVGLDEAVIRLISAKKNEPAFMLEWRLQAYRHWLTMSEPEWSTIHHSPSADRLSGHQLLLGAQFRQGWPAQSG